MHKKELINQWWVRITCTVASVWPSKFLVQESVTVLDRLLVSSLLGFVYVSVCFQYHYFLFCYDINTVYMVRLRVNCCTIKHAWLRVNEFD